MIFGSYPCCDESLMIEEPERTPAFAQEACPHCGEVVWHYLSRLQPISWTNADFETLFEVVRNDGKIVSINPKNKSMDEILNDSLDRS